MKPGLKRALVIHADPKQGEHIKKVLEDGTQFRAECMGSAIDSLPCFESSLPDLVLLQADLHDVPPELLVTAFRKMSPHVQLWLLADQNPKRFQHLAARIQANGVLRVPLTSEDRDRLSRELPPSEPPAPDWNEDETIADQEATMRGMQQVLSARDLNQKGIYRHEGAVKVIGDIEGVQRLEVLGALTVEGNILRSNIRCDGHLKISGEIRNCRRLGVFCRSFIEAGSIVDSMVVCGKSLFLTYGCLHSQVNVVNRMIGKTDNCSIRGGLTRVGEHLEIGIIGDDEHTETRVELAPEMLRKSWASAKRGLWKMAVSLNPDLAHQPTSRFRAQLRDPRFYHRHANVIARTIHAGLTIKIGDFEDYIFESLQRPVRINIGKKGKERLGIVIRKERGRARKLPDPTGARLGSSS